MNDGADATASLLAARPAVDLALLEAGSHLCALYADDAELARVAAAFVGSGLAAGDQVLYVASGRSPAQAVTRLSAAGVGAGAAMASGQLMVRGFDDIYGPAGTMDLAEIAASFRRAGHQSRADGFPGLRVAAEMGDLAAVLGSMERLLRWERIASRLQQEEGISTVCEYDRRTLAGGDAALIAIEHAGTAPDAVPGSQASFLASSTPWGWRVAGELDLANGAGLIRAVRARVPAGADLWLDVGSVSFIDIGTLAALYQTAAGLPGGSRIRLSHASAHLRHLIEISGLADPQLVVEP